jgi:hypothetical protein
MSSIMQTMTSATSSSSVQGTDRIISFFTTAVVTMFESKSISEGQLRTLLPYLLNGLRDSNDNSRSSPDSVAVRDAWRKSCGIIVATLAKKSHLSKELLASLSLALSEAFHEVTINSDVDAVSNQKSVELVYVLAVLSQFQFGRLSFAVSSLKGWLFDLVQEASIAVSMEASEFDASYASSSFVDILCTVRDKFDVRNLLQRLLDSVCQTLVAGSSGKVELEMCYMFFQVLVQRNLLEESALLEFCTKIVHSLFLCGSFEKVLAGGVYGKYLKKMLQTVYRLRIDIVENVIMNMKDTFQDADQNVGIKLLEDLAGYAAPNSAEESTSSGLSLLLSLSSANHVDNVVGINHLLSENVFGLESIHSESTRQDLVGVAEAFCNCLLSSNFSVCSAAWNPTIVSAICTQQLIARNVLLGLFDSALEHWCDFSLSSPVLCIQVVKSIIRVLADKAINSYVCSEEASITLNGAVELSGVQWNLLNLIRFISGSSILHNLGQNVEENSSNRTEDRYATELEGLESVLLDWMVVSSKQLKVLSDAVSKLKSLKRKKDDRSFGDMGAAELSASFAAGMQHPAENQQIIEVLELAVKSAHLTINGLASKSELRREVMFASILSQISGKLDTSAALDHLLTLCIPLTLKLLAAMDQATDTDLVEIGVAALSTAVAALPRLTKDSFTFVGQMDLATICSYTSKSINHDDIQFWTLQFLLDSSSLVVQKSVSGLLGACLSSAKSADKKSVDSLLPLIRLAIHGFETSGQHSAGSVLDFIASTAALSSCPMGLSATTHAGSIHAIAAWVQNTHPSADKYFAPLVSVIFSVMLLCCSDASPALRSAGITLARKLSGWSVDKSTVAGENGHAVSYSSLSQFAITLVNDATTIKMDGSAARSMIAKLFSSKQNTILKGCSLVPLEVMSSMISFAENCCASLLRLCDSVELDRSWKQISLTLERRQLESKDPVNASQLNKAVISCLKHISAASVDTQTDVVAWIIHLISYRTEHYNDESNVMAQARSDLFDQLLSVSPDWIAQIKSRDLQVAIFRSLVGEFISSGDSRVLRAASFIMVDAVLVADIFGSRYDIFSTSFQAAVTMFETDQTRNLSSSGLSAGVQALHYFLEIIKACYVDRCLLFDNTHITSVTSPNDIALVSIVKALFDFLHMSCHPVMKMIVATEYCRTLLCDVIAACLSKFSKEAVLIGGGLQNIDVSNGKDSKKKPKAKSDAALLVAVQQFSLDDSNLNLFTKIVMSSLSTVKSLQLFVSSLSVVVLLVHLLPSGKDYVIKELSSHLTALSKVHGANSQPFTIEIMKTLSQIIQSEDLNAVSDASKRQDVIQSLLENIPAVPLEGKRALLELAVGSFGPSCTPSCVLVMVAHILGAYSSSSANAASAGHTVVESSKDSSYVVLSIAAQRKARRALKVSPSEEMFQLMISFLLSLPTENQLQNLVSIIRTCYQLLDVISGVESSEASAQGSNDALGLLDVLTYASKVGVSNTQVYGTAAAFVLVLLELLVDIFANKKFHSCLVDYESKLRGSNESNQLQQFMLQLSDELLQLYTSASHKQLNYGNSESQSCEIQLADGVASVRFGLLCSQVGSRSLDILKSMQFVMDAPSFIAIFQELLGHDDSAVRQKAIQMLSTRLEDSSTGIGRLDRTEVRRIMITPEICCFTVRYFRVHFWLTCSQTCKLRWKH